MSQDNVDKYIYLLNRLIEGEITTVQFEREYLHAFKSDDRLFPQPVFDILNAIFTDVDAFVANGKQGEGDVLDEAALLARCRQHLNGLLAIVGRQI